MKQDRKKGQPKQPARVETRPPQRSRAEDSEPSTGGGGLPVGLFVLLAILLFVGMVYLDKHAGGFNPRVYGWIESSNHLVRLQPYDPKGDKLAKGLAVYNRPTCVSCHQPNGQGTPGQFPPLAGATWVTEPDPSRLIRIVLHGLQGPIEVKGQTYNNVMVPWENVLTDEDIANVLTYIRGSWGNDAPEVTPEQVAKVRTESAGRSAPWTAEELLKIPVQGGP